MVRKILPAVLRVCGREGDAVAAEALPEIVDPDSAIAARDATRKIRDAAYAAAAAAADATAYAYAYAEKLLADIRSVCKPLALELLDKLCDAKEAA